MGCRSRGGRSWFDCLEGLQFFAGFVIGLFVIRGVFPAIPGLAHVAIALATGLMVHIYREPIIALITAMAGAYIAAGAAVIMLTDLKFFHALRSYVAEAPAQMVAGIVLTVIFGIIGYKFQTEDSILEPRIICLYIPTIKLSIIREGEM